MPQSRLAWLVVAGLSILGISGCTKSEPPPPAPPEVVVATVGSRDVEIHSEWIGTVTGYVNADIRPKVEGYLLRQVYRDGAPVEAGELLFEIDPRQYRAALNEAKGQLAKTRALMVRYENDVRRYTPLAAEGAVSQKELDDAVQGLEAARAQLAADQASLENARLNLAWTKIESPIKGVAGIAQAQVGDLVKPITLLTEVSQLDPIKVSFPVSEVEYLHFAKRNIARNAKDEARTAKGDPATEEDRKGEPEARPLELFLADGSRYQSTGHVDVAGLGITRTTGTIEIQGVFANPNNLLRPGQYAKIRAVTEQIPNALLIPQRAVRDLQGITQVARIGDGNKVEFLNVELGPTLGSNRIVRSGLAAGDQVVTEGLQKIRAGMVVEPTHGKKPAETPSPTKKAVTPKNAAASHES